MAAALVAVPADVERPVAPLQDDERVPTMADAQRAAGALADAGVNCVLLYGSVARGDQAPGSDIDLLAVYDDLDYTQRPKLRDRLEKLASQAAGFEVQVSPTDRPEWRTPVGADADHLRERRGRRNRHLV